MPGPPIIRVRMLGAIMAGGIVGVALRELLLLPFTPPVNGSTIAGVLPIATLVVNVVGSFALGVVAGILGDRHPLRRAFLGTGLLGGFTTYSAFALQSALLLGAAPIAGIALALLSVALGLGAAALGLRLTRRSPGRAEGSGS